MGLYLYCFARPGQHPPQDLTGVEGRTVKGLDVTGLVAWVSALDAAPGATLDRIRQHNRVVERACETETVVPVRYGQWFEDRDRLQHHLADRAAGLRETLDRVSGAMELGIRIVETPGEGAGPGGGPAAGAAGREDRSSGRAYIESLARRARQGELQRERAMEVARALDAAVGEVARDRRARPLTSGTGLAAVAYLVGRHDISECERRVRAFAGERPDLDFQLSGPWPPYGFVDDRQAGAG